VPLAFQAEYPRFINLSTQDEADRAGAMGEAA